MNKHSTPNAQNRLSIRDLPNAQRPRERLLNNGPAALSDAELLAIILRTGTTSENVVHLSERILAHYSGLHGLAQASLHELQQFNGLGEAKTAQISAALELGKRLITYNPQERPIVNHAQDAARLVADMGQLTQEQVRVILLDTSRQVIAIPTIYIGTVNASVLRIAEVLREAITRNSPALIVVHNHPSGDPTPSPEDVELTHALIAGARLLDITLIDHLIIGQNSWSSLKELGLAF